MRKSYEKRKSLAGLMFIAPWMLGVLVFFLIPMAQSLLYSVGKITLNEGSGYRLDLIGFANYTRIFTQDASFWPNAVGSLIQTLVQTPLIILFSLFIALLLNQRFRGRTLARAIFFLPVIIASGVIIYIINGDSFSSILMAESESFAMFQSGFLRNLMVELNLSDSTVSSVMAFVAGLFDMVWKTGIQQLIFLAGLQNISPSMYEVAKIEGATGWECFWKVTFPMISPMLLLNTVYTIIDSFTDYNNGVMRYIDTFNDNMMMEQSAAMVWTYFLMVLAVMGTAYALINRKVFYD